MALSPMMQQYLAVKDQYPDALIFFRLGDFYEMFFDDAKTGSRELELTLTGRDCGDGNRAPMCGVPYHAVDSYIGRLVNKGYKVVICEQMEDPALAKGLVKRDVVRIVTPGTVTDAGQLDETKNNYICSLYMECSVAAICFADISTGDLCATAFTGADAVQRVVNEMGVYAPREVLSNADLRAQSDLYAYLTDRLHAAVYDNMESRYGAEQTSAAVRRRMDDPASLQGVRQELIFAIGALLDYIDEALKCSDFHIKNLQIYDDGQFLEMDVNTRRNLELCETMREKQKKGSLLWVLDQTKTSMGARFLRKCVEQPLVSQNRILKRQKAVAELVGDFMLREELGETLKSVLDLERLMTKVMYGSAGGKDLRAIWSTIAVIPHLKELLASAQSEQLAAIRDDTDSLDDLRELIDSAIAEDPPFSVREGGFIRAGYNAEVDRLRSIMGGAKEYLDRIEAEEKEKTGIKTMCIGYNRVFGYYLEVSNSFKDQVPEHYIRKQTLTNGERYITEELKELESTILGASDKDCTLEYELFREVCEKMTTNLTRIRTAAEKLAELDVYLSLANVAVRNGYVCPEVTMDDVIEIRDGRHPVVEKFVNDSYFVPNDTLLDCRANKLMILTGPNMAGKSTYMRQVALITVMAQIGSFVPAAEARIGIVDKLFTRVGASDDLASGQSTFMLEMTEVSYILKNATRRSLIIYDEIGRGTATYDGMSIARAVAEYTAKKISAKTLFATHYHELIDLEKEIEGVVNYNIAAKKKGDTLVFLRKIVPGGADESYGIEVAKLAGVPQSVVTRAREVLKETLAGVHTAPAPSGDAQESMNLSIDDYIANDISERLRSTDVNTLTPIEALNLIYELKKMQK